MKEKIVGGDDTLFKENETCENFRKNSKNRRYIINIKDRKTPPVDTRKKRAKPHKIRKKRLHYPKTRDILKECLKKAMTWEIARRLDTPEAVS